VINHPSKKKCPEAPKELREYYRSGKVALPLSRVEKSRVEKSKEQLEADKLLKEVNSKGLNIYELINKLKKQIGWRKAQEFPAEVLIVVCKQYLKDKGKIKSDWAWFIKVIQAESAAHFARKSVQEGEKYKSMPVAQSIKEIIKGMGK